jgi:UV DNA damage endonuclease
MTKKRFLLLERKTALQTVTARAINNLNTIYKTLELCSENNWNYRLGSDVIPLMTLPQANLKWSDFSECDELFKKCADFIKKHKIRVSMHPDQFVVPASANPTVVEKSVNELIYHAEVMDKLGLPQSYKSPINIHMNCFKGNLDDIEDRFAKVYDNLPYNVQSRLVLENEDKKNSWSVLRLHAHIYHRTGIPITYDNHHHFCNPDGMTAQQAFDLAYVTWPKNITPLFHFSGGDNNNKNPRAHGDWCPKYYADEYNTCVKNLDLEFEFKQKDLAIKKFETEKEKYECVKC